MKPSTRRKSEKRAPVSCFNEEVAEIGGIDFSHVQFQALDISDAAGTAHRFHFEVRLLGESAPCRRCGSR